MNQGPWEPPQLYSWAVVPPESQAACLGGTVGACDDEQRVRGYVVETLRDAPAGSNGIVRTCHASCFGHIEYEYEQVIGRAAVDRASGAIVWSDRWRRSKASDPQTRHERAEASLAAVRLRLGRRAYAYLKHKRQLGTRHLY